MPKLGLTSSASTQDSQKALQAISFNPTQISGLVIWYDFGDVLSMYTDAGSTNVTNSDAVFRVDNKAYSKQSNSTNAIGKFVEQATENRRPIFQTGGKQNTGYINTGNEGSTGVTYGWNTVSGLDTGSDPDVTTDTLSDTSVILKRSTWFVVIKCDITSISNSGCIFEIQNENQDTFRIWQDSSTNNIGSRTYQVSARTSNTTDSGVTSTTDTEIWTFHYGNTTTAGKIYKNGDTTAGVGNGTIQDITFDMSVDNANVDIGVANQHDISGSNDFDGKIHEILCYNGGLSDAQRGRVEDYLKFKYNL